MRRREDSAIDDFNYFDQKLVPVILTDNGSEVSNSKSIEYDHWVNNNSRAHGFIIAMLAALIRKVQLKLITL
nr:hypothetical protein [Desulfitobacterium dichloroeliminans]